MDLPSKPNEVGRSRVIHVTTSHRADDVRIFDRECRSLADCGRYEVYLAAAGEMPRGSRVNLIPLAPAPGGRSGRFIYAPRKAWGLTRALSADLWHFHDPELLPLALKMAKSGTRVVWDAHEDYVEKFADDGGKDWIPGLARGPVRSGMKAMLAAVDRQAAGVVAATDTIASRYRNVNTAVVGNEARLEDFVSCTPRFDTKRVLFTGSPGPAHLFEEVVSAVEALPDVTLAVAGREAPPQVWNSAKAKLGNRIRHLGWLDRKGLAQAISGSSVGLCTYSDVATYARTSPNKIFEFGAAGLPVVASPNPSNARFIAEGLGGFLALGFTSENLRDAIAVALSDEAVWERASRNGRDWAARAGSWEASEKRLLDLYGQILQ